MITPPPATLDEHQAIQPTKVELPNPVLPMDLEVSKGIFNDALAAAKGTPPEVVEPVETEKPKEEAGKEEKPAIEVVEPEKSKIPQELLTGDKPEAKVDDSIAEIDAMVLPKNAKAEQVASFGKLKESAKKAIEAKLARITELETKTHDGASKAEIEAAQARVTAAETKAKELEQTVERLAFTESPKFKQFTVEETASLSGAKAYLEGTEINPDIIELAARTVGPNRIKILRDAGAEADVISAVVPYLAQYDAIQRSKSSAMENWKAEAATYAEGQKAQQEAQAAQRKSEEDKIWQSVISKLETEVPAYRKFDKHDDWNQRADDLKAEAAKVFNGEGVGLEKVAEVIAMGFAYGPEHEMNLDLIEQNKQLRTENAKLKSARPGAGDGQGGLNGGEPPADETTTDRAKRTFREAQAQVRGG